MVNDYVQHLCCKRFSFFLQQKGAFYVLMFFYVFISLRFLFYCVFQQVLQYSISNISRSSVRQAVLDKSKFSNIYQGATQFKRRQCLFARPMSIAAAKEMPAGRWWMSFGTHVLELQQVAVRVLGQVTSVSVCERNWSTSDFIHTKRRNRVQSKEGARDECLCACLSSPKGKAGQ